MPRLSIIMSTQSPGKCMAGRDDDHLIYTIVNGVNRQTFKDFEVIVADCLWESRKNELDWKRTWSVACQTPIYHVPVTHAPQSMHAARNTGIMFAGGEFLLFLNDCCNFESRFLEKIMGEWTEGGLFPCPLYIMELGSEEEKHESGGAVRDPRFEVFDRHPPDADKFETGETVIDDFNIGGYFSCTLEAALDVGGVDEILGIEKFGDKLKARRHHISIHRKIVVKEQRKKFSESIAYKALGPFNLACLRNERQLVKEQYKVR